MVATFEATAEVRDVSRTMTEKNASATPKYLHKSYYSRELLLIMLVAPTKINKM